MSLREAFLYLCAASSLQTYKPHPNEPPLSVTMLQSLLIDQPVSSSSPSPSPSPPFHPDYSNWSFGRPRIMSGKESTASQQLRRSPIAAYAPPPISMAESLVPRHSYEPAVPRSYSHSPSNAPAAGEVPELQPWLFQIFPDPYTAETGAPVGYSVPVDHHNPQHPQYMHGGDGSMVYAHGRTQSYEERLHGNTPSAIGGSRTEKLI